MGKGDKTQKLIEIVLWIAICGLGIYVVAKGFLIIKSEYIEEKSSLFERFYADTQEKAIEVYMPGLQYRDDANEEAKSQFDWFWDKVMAQIPFLNYVENQQSYDTAVESMGTYEKIVAENSDFLQEKLLEENQEAGPKGSGEENTGGAGEPGTPLETADAGNNESQQDQAVPEEQSEPTTVDAIRNPVTDIPLEKFQDYDFVINNFFTIDKTTSITNEQLNAPALVEKDMRISAPGDQPQILIYHSHSQEDFVDSVEGDSSTTVVGVGNYLTTLLQETYGYNVLHLTDTFDIVNGEIDRNKAYDLARNKVTQILDENPGIEVVIDLHRDGVDEGKRLVSDVNGKPTAKIMFFNGLSRTTKNGDLTSLPNPYIQDNLAFSLQLRLEAEKYYPGLSRTIYLKGYRYNLHLRPKSLLLECGAQTNTVQEEMNAMEPFADILNKVLKGE